MRGRRSATPVLRTLKQEVCQRSAREAS